MSAAGLNGVDSATSAEWHGNELRGHGLVLGLDCVCGGSGGDDTVSACAFCFVEGVVCSAEYGFGGVSGQA